MNEEAFVCGQIKSDRSYELIGNDMSLQKY